MYMYEKSLSNTINFVGMTKLAAVSFCNTWTVIKQTMI